MLTKDVITSLIRRRRLASLLINVEMLQDYAIFTDSFYEDYWYVPAEEVPPHVYKYWYNERLRIPINPRVVGSKNIKGLYGEPKDHEWLLSQLLE